MKAGSIIKKVHDDGTYDIRMVVLRVTRKHVHPKFIVESGLSGGPRTLQLNPFRLRCQHKRKRRRTVTFSEDHAPASN